MLDTGAMVSGPLHGPSRRHPRVPDVDTWRQVWGPRPVFRPPAGGVDKGIPHNSAVK